MTFGELCECGVRFATGLMRCPRCHLLAPRFAAAAKKEKEMPRITVGGGPSNAAAAPGETGYVEPEQAETAAVETRGEAGPELVDLPDGAVVTAVGDWSTLPAAALREEAKKRGLPTGGPKTDVAARLADHDAAQAAVETETVPDAAVEEVPA